MNCLQRAVSRSVQAAMWSGRVVGLDVADVARRRATSRVVHAGLWVIITQMALVTLLAASFAPYYRRPRPKPQHEQDYVRNISLRPLADWFTDWFRGAFPLFVNEPFTVRDLLTHVSPVPATSMRALLLKLQEMQEFAGLPSATYIDLANAHLEPYDVADPVSSAQQQFDKRAAAAVHAAVGIKFRFPNATTIFDAFGPRVLPNIVWKDFSEGTPFAPTGILWPHNADPDFGINQHLYSPRDLLEMKFYGDAAETIFLPRLKCLAMLAYNDFFPDSLWDLEKMRTMVSEAILASKPGWCGTFGPTVNVYSNLLAGEISEGNYNMTQMHLLVIAYAYYDELSPAAQEHLISELLARGCIFRPSLANTFTNGITPVDYSRAGRLGFDAKRLGETENHILMILTARYLTNQLLYQRNPQEQYDNRRNGTIHVGDQPFKIGLNLTELLLARLKDILIDDFSEYNAKSYQHETRTALLNLCSFAYNHEVRLAARMVLDYISARIATSSNDLRRLVPFRRKSVDKNIAHDEHGFMTVGLLEWQRGADPMVEHFAIQAGNTRAFEHPWPARPWPWAIASGGGDGTMEALTAYRLPPLIHDLFVNDLNRRFYQRLHRIPQEDVDVTGRNADNMEINAGSPSYLITAGGEPAPFAISPYVVGIEFGDNEQQGGVAVTTSFMPTGQSAGYTTQNTAIDLIQLSNFGTLESWAANYGIAPDFACGHQLHLPIWAVEATVLQAVRRLRELGMLPYAPTVSARDLLQRFPGEPTNSLRATLYKMREIMAKNFPVSDELHFVDRGSSSSGQADRPGFYLAIYHGAEVSFLEALDTWLHPEVSFQEFRQRVEDKNRPLLGVPLALGTEYEYWTYHGNWLRFVVRNRPGDSGAEVIEIRYGGVDWTDTVGDAGNTTRPLVHGTILNTTAEITFTVSTLAGDITVKQPDAKIEIANPILGQSIALDMTDMWHPKRTAEDGTVEEAGGNREVWLNFAWTGPGEGDFFRPFARLTDAIAAVADNGTIRIVPGSTCDRLIIGSNKRIRLLAPIGDVKIGAS